MPEQDYNYVDYMCYDAESGEQKNVCRVFLTRGKLSYEGPEAAEFKKSVEENEGLAPFRELGGYSLLAMLPHAYKGSYNFCTKVKQRYEADE